MKHALAILFLIGSIASLCTSQTEQWRIPGLIKEIRPDGNGNTYITRGTNWGGWGGPDTLFKIDKSGSVKWTLPFPGANIRLYNSGSGVYAHSMADESGTDTVYYVDSLGTLQWKYVYPNPHLGYSESFSLPVDPSGNLIYPVFQTTPQGGRSVKLLKFDRSGSILFQRDLPVETSGIQPDGREISVTYQGPYVDGTGTIWMVISSEVWTTTQTRSLSKSLGTYSSDVMLLSGTSGATIWRKNLESGTESVNKDYTNGRHEDFSITNFPIYDFAAGVNQLFGYGFNAIHNAKCLPTRGCKIKERSSWVAVRIDQQSNVVRFGYRGNGLLLEAGGSDVYTTDGSSNYLYHGWVGKNNAFYLDGEVSRGRSSNGVGQLHYDYVLLKLSSTFHGIEWKKVFPDFQPAYLGRIFFHKGEQKIMIQSADNHTISVVDQNGVQSQTTLTFPGNLWRLADNQEPLVLANTEEGVLYAAFVDSNYWAGRYALPPLSFTASPLGRVGGNGTENDLAEYKLQQNYPNPFNPVTTIEFDLGAEALVTAKVYNILGQEIAAIANREEFGAGTNSLEFDGSRFPSGVYYYRITAEDLDGKGVMYTDVKRMILLK